MKCLEPLDAGTRTTLAVVADDQSKSDAIGLLRAWRTHVERWKLVATRETGNLIEARLGLDVDLVEPGARGGTYQIASLVVSERIAAVIGLSQQSARGRDVALAALREVCDIHNVPFASNVATAEAVLAWLLSPTGGGRMRGVGLRTPSPGAGHSDDDSIGVPAGVSQERMHTHEEAKGG